MKAENTNAVVEFIFKGLEPPCMVLAQEACRILYTPDGKVVKKPNNPASPQYLKVLKPIFWDQRPSLHYKRNKGFKYSVLACMC